LEIDERYYGGRGKPESRGRGLSDPNKSLMAIAVETRSAGQRQGTGIKKSRFVAGSARIVILPAASTAELGNFVRNSAQPGARIITDGLTSYDGLSDSFRHYSIVQDGGKNADAVLPNVHVLFSNLKSWLSVTKSSVDAQQASSMVKADRFLHVLLVRRTAPTCRWCDLMVDFEATSATDVRQGL
jgi:hypothetical protein